VDIKAIVCPKQKLVKMYSGNGKKCTLLKVYRFKEKIPLIRKTIMVQKYDFSAWSVSDRDYEVEKAISVYDENIIESIKQRALTHYLTTQKQHKSL